MEEFNKRPFKVGEREFVTIAAYDEKAKATHVWVQTKDGGPVVVTFSDGSKVTYDYRVTLEMEQDLAALAGINAVERLMKTAEATVRDNVEQGLS
ncbi:hypothetical protein D7Y27_23735 [Corallococcus sp. AB004]|nr:hypothetical protein D7Y27_23735 [Corallococcus sp. AB004]